MEGSFYGQFSEKRHRAWYLGLAMSFLSESFQLAAQTISMQTGFGFASTVDPAAKRLDCLSGSDAAC